MDAKISGQKKTIRERILSGYLKVVFIIMALIVVSLGFLIAVERGYKDASHYQTQQSTAQEVMTSHYKWLNSLSQSILDGTEFTGSLNPDTCSLGKWIGEGEIQTIEDPELLAALESIVTPHNEIHATAAVLVEQSKTQRDAAYQRFATEIRPRIEEIGSGLTIIGQRLKTISEEKILFMGNVVVISIAMSIGLGLLAIVLSLLYATKISSRIAKPLSYVTECSEEISTGIDNVHFKEGTSDGGILEIQRMMSAFGKLVAGIQNDVAVIKRITQGDLTVYVDIKSEGDPLGRNLYRLVQNNDMMFANLLRVADEVARASQNIAQASHNQAAQAVEQAGAVSKLSETVEQANQLAIGNAGRATQAADVSTEIRSQIERGSQQMELLLAAVAEINTASLQINGVMKAIDDVAFQTNILALNAAVEAARAGEAGKGFAVVADEVRNLALKSAEAAKRSGAMIENTIQKTAEGTRISEATSGMFREIVESTGKIAQIVDEISTASNQQQHCIEDINTDIQVITQSVSSNAATSEETAAATQEMTDNAALIRIQMKKFNLRQRDSGKAYIPAEKANDPEFIRIANENYKKAMQSGQQNLLGDGK